MLIKQYHALACMKRKAAWARIRRISELVNPYKQGVFVHHGTKY